MQSAPSQKPCLVETPRGFSVFYNERFLYSKYAPDKAIEGTISSLQILPGTLILALSPALWLGLPSLLKKLPENCFVLGIEFDENLHEFSESSLEKLKSENSALFSRVALLPFSENEYFVNVLCGEKSLENLKIPHISTFRRAIPLEMSAGTQFSKEKYFLVATNAENAVASFWKNRITLTKLGRLFSRNLFRNLSNLPYSVDFKNLLRKIKNPIFVFGAGESIDETLAKIPKNLLEKCFVFAVDAAAAALKSRKIRIDAVCAVEGQVAIEKAYIGGAAKNSLLIADMTSRRQVARHAKKVSYVSSKYTDSSFFKNLSEKEFFPPLIPALGSVGLSAVHIALLLRESVNVPVFFSGLDFSFSIGRTHAKNTPAHIARLCSSNRLNPVENYSASFRLGAKKIIGKNAVEVCTDTALEGYAKSFRDVFASVPNLYDAGGQGIPLLESKIQNEKLSAYLETLSCDAPADFLDLSGMPKKGRGEEVKKFLESEEKALNRIKELLMFGKKAESASLSLESELGTLILPREYLFLHFPDGYKFDAGDLSFLKRVRGQIDFFLKDLKQLAISN